MLKRFVFIAAISALMLAGCGGQMTPVPTLTPTPGGEPLSPDASGGPDALATALAEKEEWDNHYSAGTMTDIIVYADTYVEANESQMYEAAGEENGPYTFHPAGEEASLIRVPMRYTGECRPISEEHLLAMRWWIGTHTPENLNMFLDLIKQECRFTELEGETEYWLPTQEVIIENQAAGLLVGQELTIYVQYLGSIVPEQGEPEHLYFVNYYWVEPTTTP